MSAESVAACQRAVTASYRKTQKLTAAFLLVLRTPNRNPYNPMAVAHAQDVAAALSELASDARVALVALGVDPDNPVFPATIEGTCEEAAQ